MLLYVSSNYVLEWLRVPLNVLKPHPQEKLLRKRKTKQITLLPIPDAHHARHLGGKDRPLPQGQPCPCPQYHRPKCCRPRGAPQWGRPFRAWVNPIPQPCSFLSSGPGPPLRHLQPPFAATRPGTFPDWPLRSPTTSGFQSCQPLPSPRWTSEPGPRMPDLGRCTCTTMRSCC